MNFYLYILDNFPDARQVLPNLDYLGVCPDQFRAQIQANYENPKHVYAGLST